MAILRRVAATHMAAVHAQAKVDPGVAGFQAVFAAALAVLVMGLRDLGGHVVAGFDGQRRAPLS
jgi:hypothetical protein